MEVGLAVRIGIDPDTKPPVGSFGTSIPRAICGSSFRRDVYLRSLPQFETSHPEVVSFGIGTVGTLHSSHWISPAVNPAVGTAPTWSLSFLEVDTL